MSTIHCCYQPSKVLNEELIHLMLQSSDYWKPDDKSSLFNSTQNCALGKANLFNTSYSKNDFVYLDAASNNIISANARIDNRKQLLEELNIQNPLVTDSELILSAYQKWDKACLNHLLGDFAFIIWDAANNKIFAARDYFGVKLLMYNQKESGTMISNEPAAFFQSGWIKKNIKENWLAQQIWGLFNNQPETAYKGLEILPPAHYLEIKENDLKIERYWEIPNNNLIGYKSKNEILSELKALFENAVKVRLETDYPLACQLSEGLDSNGITGLTAKELPHQNIYTFSYKSLELNEDTKLIWEKTYKDIHEMLALHPNLKPVWSKTQIDIENSHLLVNNLEGAINCLGQFTEHCKLAEEKNIRVLLSGWGGDHCVSSPGDFYESELLSKFKIFKLYQLLRDKRKRGRGGNPIKAIGGLFIKHYLPKLFFKRNKSKGLENSMLYRRNNNFLHPKYIEKYQLKKQLNKFIKEYQARYSTKDYSKRELFEIGVEKRLIDSELTGRMYRLEYRFPMLDVPLVEFAYNMPSYLKVYNGIERYAFREIIKGLTTERIRLRRKADVVHPNFENRNQSNPEDVEKILKLINTPLFHQYFNLLSVNKNIEQPHLVNLFLRSYPILNYYSNINDVKIGEEE